MIAADSTAIETPATEVRVCVANDADAERISAVLGALGYNVKRDLGDASVSSRLEWSAERLAARHKLSERGREILLGVLQGMRLRAIAAKLEISEQTVKWHLGNIFHKTGTSRQIELLRRALEID